MTTAAQNRNIIGVVSIVLGVLIFSTQDAIVKSLSAEHAVSLAIVVRGIISVPILFAFVMFEGGLSQMYTKQIWFLIGRGLILLAAYTFYYLSFPALPLAEAITLYFMAPLLITILSGPVLGEKIKTWSWIAVAIGLIGVFVILQPGSALFEPAALLSLGSAITYAIAMVLARKYGTYTPASVMAFYQNAVYLVGALLFAAVISQLEPHDYGHPSLNFLMREWRWPSNHDLGLLMICGVVASFGMSLLTHGYRTGDANIVTIFEYTGMVWASLWGYMFFNEVPRLTTFIGMLMIAAAGIISLRASATRT